MIDNETTEKNLGGMATPRVCGVAMVGQKMTNAEARMPNQ